MASLTIRNLDDPVKARLRIRATYNGHSMEEEARVILREALEPKIEGQPAEHLVTPKQKNFLIEAHERFCELGGLDLPDYRGGAVRDPPEFKK